MLNLDERTRTKAAWVTTLLAPLLAVQAVRYLVIGDAAPIVAGAAVTDSTQPPVGAPAAPKPLSTAQIKAAHWLASRTVALNLRSPMDRPDPVAPASAPSTALPEAKTPPAPSPVPQTDDTPRTLVLTGILGGAAESSRSLASINHRIYRIGDEVAPGWRVASIDSKKREVVVAHGDGRTLTLAPPLP